MARRYKKILVAGIVAALVACSLASADPPGRVGRLNLIQGGVSFRPDTMDEWTAATLNYPLTAGDSLWTDEASLAEVHVGSTAIRLGPRTECSFLGLDDQKVQLSLPQGLLNVRLRQLDSDESFEVDTPTMSISLLGPGSYRIDVRGSGDTQATANEGELEAFVDGLSYPIRAHQSACVARSDSLSIEIRKAPAAGEWERWCVERDRREDRLVSVKYVPRAMIGCEDLDWYGSWRETPDYGPVWIPSSLPAGWAPYRFGHWAWVQPWGWTWIDDMPWGFAPFHYGRWALFRGIWVWVPGSIAQRPVYAPALVVLVEAGKELSRVRVSGTTPPVAQQRESVRASTASPWVKQLFRVAEHVLQAAPKQEAVQSRPQLRRAPKEQAPQTSQKLQKVRKKKKLPNGQWVWVEEWIEE